MPLEEVEVVFFDFDGVILESAGIKTAAFAEIFDGAAASMQFHLENQGISRYEKFRFHRERVLGLRYDDDVEQSMNAAFDAIVQRQVDSAPFVPGALDLLQALRDRIPAYVASGTPEGELERIVGVRNLGDFFDGVHGSPRAKGEIVGDVLTRLDVSPARALFIGDATADFAGAAEAGVMFVGRVAPGEENPFSERVAVVSDLEPLIRDWVVIRPLAERELRLRAAQ